MSTEEQTTTSQFFIEGEEKAVFAIRAVLPDGIADSDKVEQIKGAASGALFASILLARDLGLSRADYVELIKRYWSSEQVRSRGRPPPPLTRAGRRSASWCRI